MTYSIRDKKMDIERHRVVKKDAAVKDLDLFFTLLTNTSTSEATNYIMT